LFDGFDAEVVLVLVIRSVIMSLASVPHLTQPKRNSEAVCFDLTLIGTPQFSQIGGLGAQYFQVGGLSGFIGECSRYCFNPDKFPSITMARG
jgi:hypothetical protein